VSAIAPLCVAIWDVAISLHQNVEFLSSYNSFTLLNSADHAQYNPSSALARRCRRILVGSASHCHCGTMLVEQSSHHPIVQLDQVVDGLVAKSSEVAAEL